MTNLARKDVWPVFMMYALPLSASALALAIAFGRTRRLEEMLQAFWNRVPRREIARRTGLAQAADFMRPKFRSLLRQAGLAG